MDLKLVIWDLDDTLWRGSLAENDDVHLIDHRVEYIRLLNSRGVVSAICSKNDPGAARKTLIAFEIWDDFVFPRISFAPKGPAVRQLIADMQLRPENVLLIDDNAHNLHEVQFLMPEISVVDANTDCCDQLLEALLQSTRVSESRVQQYRMLEARHYDRSASTLPQEAFLRSCNIRLSFVHRMDNLDFVPKIERLISRSNQLNFTKSRIIPGEISEIVADITNYNCISVFLWDNYGYHGLVGFAALGKAKRIVHFVFSCRIMHMGVENYTLEKLRQLFPGLDLSTISVAPNSVEWIAEVSSHETSIRAKIYENEFSTVTQPAKLRIMANCQSGAIAHFSGLADVAIFDNSPQTFNFRQKIDRVFYLRSFLDEEHLAEDFPEMLVYGAFVDYVDNYWPDISTIELEATTYRKCVQRFCDFVDSSGRNALVILPFEKAPDHKIPKHFGLSQKRLAHFNRIWRNAARNLGRIEILDLNLFAKEAEAIDVRHYNVELLKKIAEYTRSWYDSKQLAGRPSIQVHQADWPTNQ